METYTSVRIDEQTIPLKIVAEYRKSARVALGVNEVILRIPSFAAKNVKHYIDWCTEWLQTQYNKKPNILDRYISRDYHHGDIMIVCGEQFNIEVRNSNDSKSKISLQHQTLTLELSKIEEYIPQNKDISNLVSKLMARRFRPHIIDRVNHYNLNYFKEGLRNIRLKYNKSNWGSCSVRSNINLSTRILLAPKEVQDYIIVHELSHLKEMNHSPAFWSVVKSVLPNYKLQERWIKENGHNCYF